MKEPWQNYEKKGIHKACFKKNAYLCALNSGNTPLVPGSCLTTKEPFGV